MEVIILPAFYNNDQSLVTLCKIVGRAQQHICYSQLFSGTFLFSDLANEHKDVPPVLGI